jgi:hypothetical protein
VCRVLHASLCRRLVPQQAGMSPQLPHSTRGCGYNIAHPTTHKSGRECYCWMQVYWQYETKVADG